MRLKTKVVIPKAVFIILALALTILTLIGMYRQAKTVSEEEKQYFKDKQP